MELEARELDKIADIFDPKVTKIASAGTCERCTGPTISVNDLYCVTCAVSALRDMAKHLRQYL